MQLEMEKDSECDKECVVCCGYDAMLLRGSELDDAPRSEWTKATRPGWRMLIMPPQLPGKDAISLVAVKKNYCEKTYEQAEARRVQYKAGAKVQDKCIHQCIVFTLVYDSVHSIVLCVLILLLFDGIFNSINCEKNA